MKDKSTKVTEANARNAAWAKLTPVQQMEYLNTHGFYAQKQRAKIQKRIDAGK